MESLPVQPMKTRAKAGWIVLAVLVMTSLSCRAALGSLNSGVTPTTTELATQMDSLPTDATTASSLPADETPVSTPAETATPLPPGTQIDVTGVVQEIRVENNFTLIVVNGIVYRVPPEILVIIIQHLHVGAPIVFVGRADVSGVIIIINVIQIDNVTILINPPEKKHGGEDGDDQGEDEDD